MENLVKLTPEELIQLSDGELIYINHPEKGICYVDMNNIFVNTVELTQEEKDKLTTEK